MIMKLITVAALLFSTSVMAANQCKPDDVCMSFTPDSSGEKGFSVECKDIYFTELKNDIYDTKKLSVKMTRSIDVKNEASLTGYSYGVIRILSYEYGHVSVDDMVKDKIYLSINDEQIDAANALISCVDSLKSK
ncbi:hypothetical protein GKR71_00270 [Providencia sp. wls1922]|nr:hypothetical protein [Providencia sp. wls1922]